MNATALSKMHNSDIACGFRFSCIWQEYGSLWPLSSLCSVWVCWSLDWRASELFYSLCRTRRFWICSVSKLRSHTLLHILNWIPPNVEKYLIVLSKWGEEILYRCSELLPSTLLSYSGFQLLLFYDSIVSLIIEPKSCFKKSSIVKFWNWNLHRLIAQDFVKIRIRLTILIL